MLNDITFDHGTHIKGDRLRDWNKFAVTRLRRLIGEANIADATFKITVFGSHPVKSKRPRMFTVKVRDEKTRNLVVDVWPGNGSYIFECRIGFSTLHGFEVVAQRIETACNRLSVESQLVEPQATQVVKKTVKVDMLVKLRDGLTSIIDFGQRAMRARDDAARLGKQAEHLEGVKAERLAHAVELRDDLAAVTELADAAAASFAAHIAHLRDQLATATSELAQVEDELCMTRLEQEETQRLAEEKAGDLESDPVVLAILKAMPGVS